MKILVPFFLLSSYVYAYEPAPEVAALVVSGPSLKPSTIKVRVSKKEDPYDISDKAITADPKKRAFVEGINKQTEEAVMKSMVPIFDTPEMYAFAVVYCSGHCPNIFLDYMKCHDDVATQAINLLYKSNPKLFSEVIKKFEKLPFMEASLCGSDLALNLDELFHLFAEKLNFLKPSNAVERIFKESNRVAHLLSLFEALNKAELKDKLKDAVISATKLSLEGDEATLNATIEYINNFQESYLKELEPSHLSSADPVRMQQLIKHATKDELEHLGERIKGEQFLDALKLCNAQKKDPSVPATRELHYGQGLSDALWNWVATSGQSGLGDPFHRVVLAWLFEEHQFKKPMIQAPAIVSNTSNSVEEGGDKQPKGSKKPKTRRIIRKKSKVVKKN